MKHYETIYIVKPDLSEEDYKTVVKKYNDLLEKQKGVLVKMEEWGKQRLAYEVKKFDQGYYVYLDYCGASGMTSAIERDLKLDDRILKFQTVKLADDADPQELILKAKEVHKVRTSEETREFEEVVQEEKPLLEEEDHVD